MKNRRLWRLVPVLLPEWFPHPHWWRYFWSSEYAEAGEEDESRECRLCGHTEFAGHSRRLS